MPSQPPSFEPGSRRRRPGADGARPVRSTSEQLDEWASTQPPAKPKPPARRSVLERELGMQPGEADASQTPPIPRRRRGAHRQLPSDAASRARPGGSAQRLPASQPATASPPSASGLSSASGPSRGSAVDRTVVDAPPSIRPRSGDDPTATPRSEAPGRETARPRIVAPAHPDGPGRGDPDGPTRPGGPSGPSLPGRPKPRRWLRRTLLTLAVLLVLAIAWPFYLVWYGNSELDHVEALSDRADTPGTTYLIVGSDKREAGGIEDVTEGQRADTIMLLQVPESGKPALVSLPRDTYVNIPGHDAGKINSAYAIGGPKLLVRTVEELSGMTVDHYVEVSMGGVKDLVDAVDGVNLCYDRDVNDIDSQLYWQAGCHDVNGTQALAFSRMRKSDPLGDIGRAMRQRQVVSKLVDKIASPSLLVHPLRQRDLVGSVAKNLTTDDDTGLISLGKAGLGMRDVIGEGGLMGAPPIADLNYRVGGQSTVALNIEVIDSFFEKMKNGTLTVADLYQAG